MSEDGGKVYYRYNGNYFEGDRKRGDWVHSEDIFTV